MGSVRMPVGVPKIFLNTHTLPPSPSNLSFFLSRFLFNFHIQKEYFFQAFDLVYTGIEVYLALGKGS